MMNIERVEKVGVTSLIFNARNVANWFVYTRKMGARDICEGCI